MRTGIAGWGVLGVWLAANVAVANEGVIFRWVDAKGNVYAADDLADVPEPFHSLYAAKLRELADAKRKAGASSSPAEASSKAPERPPAATTVSPESERPSLVDAEAERRQRWKALIAHWRSELAAATEELVRLEERTGELRANPLLAVTPSVREEIDATENARARALARLEAARRMLLVELPSRAKKEHVPPAWLL